MPFRTGFAAIALLLATAGAASADGFVTPFIGYNFGGDSGNCPALRNCSEKQECRRLVRDDGRVFGVEEDISFAKNFFGDSPGTDNWSSRR